MLNIASYVRENYGDYLISDHWINLKNTLLTNTASCFICDKKYSLVLHHVNYLNLYKEKLYRDVYIVCWKCHKRCHYRFWFIKIPLVQHKLLKRLYELRAWHAIIHGDLGKIIAASFRIVTS